MSNAASLQSKPVTDMPVFQLIYRSHSKIDRTKSQEELGRILRTSRTNNAERGVTGALMMYGDWFAQVLEGPQAVVESLYAKIKADTRHDTLDVRSAKPVEARAFRQWAMANIGEHGTADIPLIAVATGVQEGGARKATTPEQEQVLTILRDMTRGYGQGS